jgi:hypothetical protein
MDCLGKQMIIGFRACISLGHARDIKQLISFLTEAESNALLAACDLSRWEGRLDRAGPDPPPGPFRRIFSSAEMSFGFGPYSFSVSFSTPRAR